MVDLGIYAALAGLIGAIGGLVSGLLNSWIQSKVQKRSLDIQERQLDVSAESSNTAAAASLAGSASQQAIQLYSALQGCIQTRQDAYTRIRELELMMLAKDLRIRRAISDLKELLQEHEEEYRDEGKQCSVFERIQAKISSIQAMLAEEPNG